METRVIKQGKSRKGVVVMIPVAGVVIHMLIRVAYGMSLQDFLVIASIILVTSVLMVFIVDIMCKQTIFIDQDGFRMKTGVITHTYCYEDVSKCIYRNHTHLKLKLKNGKSKELYLGEFDYDGRNQLISSVKSHGIEVVDLSI
ncbi:hypothetical protein [Butyrivibrio sp. LB2008]|uniref:hypothetical protein n=1 Tax=Butyrivibrio sp. LB2008 TaxID=1408305 RepID=UPI00047AE8DC|nr:hypothetical protein [Butyrivibrio sp. LB2008]